MRNAAITGSSEGVAEEDTLDGRFYRTKCPDRSWCGLAEHGLCSPPEGDYRRCGTYLEFEKARKI